MLHYHSNVWGLTKAAFIWLEIEKNSNIVKY